MIASALIASSLPLVGATPAHAVTISYATTTADDGTELRLRIVKPDTGSDLPAVVYKGGTGSSRCETHDLADAGWLAALGYVSVTFQGRGHPYRGNAGGCNPGNSAELISDIQDSLNDSGGDWGGSNDIQDVVDIVEYTRGLSYVADAEVAFMGLSLDGYIAYLVAHALDDTANPLSAVIVSGGFAWTKGDNVASLSNEDTASWNAVPATWSQQDVGVDGRNAPEVLTNLSEWHRHRYLGTTPSTGVSTWMENRTFVDDNSTVDKAGDLNNTPILIMHGMQDMYVSMEHATQTFNKLPNNGNKYLYLGACNLHENDCPNAPRDDARLILFNFLERYVDDSTAASIGGPIWFNVPPAYSSVSPPTTAGTWSSNTVQSSQTSWPPTSCTNEDLTTVNPCTVWTDWYLRTAGGGIYGLHYVPSPGSGVPTTAETPHSYNNPDQTAPFSDICTATTYSAGEYVDFDGYPLQNGGKIVGLEASLVVESSSTSATELEVVADVFEVTSGGAVIPLGGHYAGGVWIRPSQIITVPIKHGVTVGTKYEFVFRPFGIGHTLLPNSKIRLRVASNFRSAFAPARYPGVFKVHHSSTSPSKLRVLFAATT